MSSNLLTFFSACHIIKPEFLTRFIYRTVENDLDMIKYQSISTEGEITPRSDKLMEMAMLERLAFSPGRFLL